ncbi:MAG TPA: hypothetical protein PKA06_14360, partial [Gemmatales bacterium]|nr:hypothetical protein [Gemmatales bacterium]
WLCHIHCHCCVTRTVVAKYCSRRKPGTGWRNNGTRRCCRNRSSQALSTDGSRSQGISPGDSSYFGKNGIGMANKL